MKSEGRWSLHPAGANCTFVFPDGTLEGNVFGLLTILRHNDCSPLLRLEFPMIVIAGYAIGSLFTLAAVANVCRTRQPVRFRAR